MSRDPGRKAFPWLDALGADDYFLTSQEPFPTSQPGTQGSCLKRKPEEGPGRGPKESGEEREDSFLGLLISEKNEGALYHHPRAWGDL